MRAALESLLRARKLDITLTRGAAVGRLPPDRLAPTGRGRELDAALGGGLRRGHLSEIVGTAVERPIDADGAGAGGGDRDAAKRCALVDACDTFDPASAAALGIDR